MNTYLIVSETNYFINKKIASITNNSDNTITYDLNNSSIDEVFEEASYFSMFNDMKYLIVKNAYIFESSKKEESKKNKESSEKLLNYLNNENKDTTIIFISKSVDSKKKIYKVLNECNNVFIYKNLTKTDMVGELKNIINENGYKIDNNSLWYIINNTLGNFDIAVNEINKIMTYYSSPCYIEYNVVENLTSNLLEDNNFKLVEAIVKKDMNTTMKLLNDFNILNGEPNLIISLLYREYKLMLGIKYFESKKVDYNTILKKLNLAPWQYDKSKDNARGYSTQSIKKEIIKLSKLDYKYKSGLIDKDLLLINYII